MDLDLSWTAAVYLTVNQSPLKGWTENKWMEQHTDSSRSDKQWLDYSATNYRKRYVSVLFFSHWKSETFLLLAYQGKTYPAMPILRSTHRIKSYLWEATSLSVALWWRGRALVTSALARATHWWTQHDSAEGRTLPWWLIRSHLPWREPTFFVTATKKTYYMDLWCLRDVRQQNLSITLCFYV